MAHETLTAIPLQVPSEETVAAPDAVARSGVYALLAALLRGVPEEALLARVRELPPAIGRNEFALAWEGLRLAAACVTQGDVEDEYHRLFIGLGAGELLPYASWYRTGFLMEQPLGVLRRDLVDLGFERKPGVCEPEDHIAALCEVMGILALDAVLPFDRQRVFHRAHLAPWVQRFSADLEGVSGAPFYAAVGRLASAFFAVEGRYLEIEL